MCVFSIIKFAYSVTIAFYTCSGGNMRKLSVALALTGGPPILLMVRKSLCVRKGKSSTHLVAPGWIIKYIGYIFDLRSH